jgi:hypothetical protein
MIVGKNHPQKRTIVEYVLLTLSRKGLQLRNEIKIATTRWCKCPLALKL